MKNENKRRDSEQEKNSVFQRRTGGHESFYPRDRWFYKGVKYIHSLNDEYPTDKLGVGINMVKSIRFWLRAAEMTEDDDRLKLSEWIRKIMKFDQYLSSPVTNYLIHYRIVSGRNSPLLWKWFFSYSDIISFSSESVPFSREQWISFASSFTEKETGTAPDRKTLQKEFSVFTGMYCSGNDDLFYPSPFLFMDLISFNPRLDLYRRNKASRILPEVLFYLIYMFRKKEFPDTLSLDLDTIMHIPASPMRIFMLNADDIAAKHAELDPEWKECFRLSRSSGMNILTIKETDENRLIESMYETSHEFSFLLLT